MDLSVDEIARLVGGTVVGDGSRHIRGLNGLRRAESGELTFYADSRYEPLFSATRASAVLVGADIDSGPTTLIRVDNPYAAFAQLLHHREAELLCHHGGVHSAAAIDPTAEIGEAAAIGPYATIDAGASVGARSVIYPGVYIGRDCVVGADCVLYPNVVLRDRCFIGDRCIIHPNVSIGGDGFGFAAIDGKRVKIPQVGNVVIGDEVEIGSNSSIDRATAGSTRIGNGTKIDCQVQIGHNAEVGEHCAISGCCGISGSALIGNNVTIGGFSAINGHIEIGDNALIGGRSSVTASVPAGAVFSGFPATDHAKARRYLASKFRLPEALKRLRQLEKRVEELERD